MLSLSPQSRIFVAVAPVDGRKGIDGLVGVCRQRLLRNPLDGAVFVFRNRRATTIRILFYDGQGMWCCSKRLSANRFQWWPSGDQTACQLSARELAVLLWNGVPAQANMAPDWRQVA